MKLYEVPNNTWIRVKTDTHVPPGARSVKEGEKIFFRKTNGMYSLCTLTDSELPIYSEAIHLVAWAEVEIIDSNTKQE